MVESDEKTLFLPLFLQLDKTEIWIKKHKKNALNIFKNELNFMSIRI